MQEAASNSQERTILELYKEILIRQYIGASKDFLHLCVRLTLLRSIQTIDFLIVCLF